MKILSIGFKNPFHESGYTNTIEINNLENINVFIGKNNSGKTNVLRSIFNLLHQDIDRCKIFRYLKVKLDHKDINLILGKFSDKILKIYQNRNNPIPETDRRKNRLKSNLENGKFVNAFNPLYNLKQKTDNPFSKTFSMILNFNCDVTNHKILFNYDFENIDDLDVDLKPTIEEILKGISLDQDLASLLIDHILPLKNVILIPSFRTLGSSEKDYQTQEITKIKETIKLLFEKSFNRIPIDLPREKPFEIPNLALILNTIKRGKISSTYRSLIGPEFFETFNSSLRQIFPNIKLSITWNFSDQKTIGGYIEDDKDMGNWSKLGHGTHELISLLFLLMLPRDGIYIIDEPENGLHPGLQSKLLHFIKHIILTDSSYNKQFFFASHSTSFIDFRGNCSHFVCKKDKEKFSIELLEKKKLHIIRTELGLKPSALLQANGIIWVEGVSGKPYVKMLFQCFGVNLDDLDVAVIHFGGGADITSNHYTIDLLESMNPNFCIIIDSEKDDINDEIDELLEKKTAFEERGHFFWILEKFRNIEGIIPQEAINEYFDIKIPLSIENLKQPFENLTSYIKRLKDPTVGIIPEDRKKYNKTRDAPRICELIKSNPDYKLKITENKYLHESIKNLVVEIEEWSNIEISIYDKKRVNELFNSIMDLLEYLESEEYWVNSGIRDEKLNIKILNFTENIEDLKKYFGLNIISQEQGSYFKTITLLEGRYIITFKIHAPYKSTINKKGRVMGPFRLDKRNTAAQKIKELIFSEIRNKLKMKHNNKL